MQRQIAMPQYPAYQYPFSTSGQVEDQLNRFASQSKEVPISSLMRILKPNDDFGILGSRMLNPRYFREFYPSPAISHFDSSKIWAAEQASATNGYPNQCLAPGVRIGDMFQCKYGEPLLRGGPPVWQAPQPYHCPYGWRRFGLHIDDFDNKYGKWAIAYHGTTAEGLLAILDSFIRPGRCQEGGDGRCVYLSPSIEYASAPRYAEPYLWHGTRDNSQRWLQFALQFRVCKPDYLQAETLGAKFHPSCPGGWASRPWGFQIGGAGRGYPRKHKKIDPHFSNDELEWLYSDRTWDLEERLVPTGVMIRIVKENPVEIMKKRQDSTPMLQHPEYEAKFAPPSNRGQRHMPF